MAFFTAISSSIGRKLLLFGLRHIDILDKDPADFINVDVGKETTLEVRDVGLHVKKLVTLLHLKLPPEVHLSKARASLLRVTFVLDFGIPSITIEIDGVQVHARLAEEEDSNPRGKEAAHLRPSKPFRSSPPHRPSSPRPPPPNVSDTSSDFGDDEHIPTVDDLAESFIREEPEEEIRELEEAINTRSEYLQESVSSSDEGDDESVAGVGAPLGLPGYLRNMFNTALDRLQIIANHIDIEVEDQFPAEPSEASRMSEDPFVSLNFHVDRIAIDSVISPELKVDVGSKTSALESDSKLGKRRMRIENICARLISDAENFATMSRVSRPSSPADTRSVVSSSQKSQSETSASRFSTQPQSPSPVDPTSPVQQHSQSSRASFPTNYDEGLPSSPEVDRQTGRLASSVVTTDEDRFADAASEDGLDQSIMNESMVQSQRSIAQQGMAGSSLLYEDDGILEYALENEMFDSRFGDVASVHQSQTKREKTEWEGEGFNFGHEATQSPSQSTRLPTVSRLLSSPTLEGQSRSNEGDSLGSQQSTSQTSTPSTDNLKAGREHVAEGDHGPIEAPLSSSTFTHGEPEDLAESKMFSHEDAESMYMSAMSAPPTAASFRPHIPGGWDSSSVSSQDTASDSSAPIPSAMVAGSILGPLPEADDGCETPRPGSRHSAVSSPSGRNDSSQAHDQNYRFPPDNSAVLKVAKVILSVDQITVWFPLRLSGEELSMQSSQTTDDQPEFSISPPNLGQDSIYQEMPGSFSNYAHSTSSRRKPSFDASVAAKRRPEVKAPPPKSPVQPPKKGSSTAVSVEVGSVVGKIDVSTGRIIFQMIDRSLRAMTDDFEPMKKEVSKSQSSTKTEHSNIECSIKHIDIAWMESLAVETLVGGDPPRSRLNSNPVDAILKLQLSTLFAVSHIKDEATRSKLCIGKFVLSTLDQDIISFFGQKPKPRRSISHSSIDPLNHDIEIDIENSKEQRITIVTRPVKVVFDLQKLDDALGSFGGFSGVLELGSSISSSSAIHSPMVTATPPKPRGVHFGDVPPAPALPTTSSTMPKIDVQFGEVTLVLKGRSCAVNLQTTSVRAAIRQSNVRLKVQEVQLSGPYVDSSHTSPPLVVDVRGTSITFLFSPEEVDLTRLISMITPSKDPYENDEDILIDTLLRQRRKGSVLRAEVASIGVRIEDLDQLKTFDALGTEIAKLSKVTKYLPDDDRPGILVLGLVQQFDATVYVNNRLGDISIVLQETSLAHVGVPSLLALEIGTVLLKRDEEILLHEVVKLRSQDRLPMIMTRIIGDEMEPVIKAKLFNVCAEYHVTTVMAALGLSDQGTVDEIALGLAASVATVTGASSPKHLSRQTSASSSPSSATPKPLHIDLLLRSCAFGLNPRKIPSKGLFVLSDARLLGKQANKNEYVVSVELRKASIHAIDNIGRVPNPGEPSTTVFSTPLAQHQLFELREQGYVSLSSISAARVLVGISGDGKDKPQIVEVEFKNELFVLESCADSTQTLIGILNGLSPPMPPSTAQKYRTVVPLQEMMESFTGDAFMKPEPTEEENFMDKADLVEDEVPTNLEFVGSFYNAESLPSEEDMGDSMLGEDDLEALTSPPNTRKRGERGLLESFQEQYEVAEGERDFDFDDKYFQESDSENKGKARKWDSRKNRYELTNEFRSPDAPLRVRVRDVNIVWHLYDGYDWPRTRGIISQAVEDVEARAEERRQRPRDDDDDDDDFVEQDFLFNSVWIGVPIKEEKGALAKQINRDIDDLASETGSYATSTATRSTGATIRPRSATKSSRRRLKLERSKNKKIAIHLSGVALDLIVFPPDSGETENSINLRLRDFEIRDHVPSSTWNKFVTSIIEPSQRELERPMIDLEVLTVKPVTELAASELVIRVVVQPLRLHVDQDALDFITRFFEFKDDSAPENSTPSDQPFIQRLEVMAVTLKLDYKPKRVDYRGLRSGHTTEFMNFLILDGADIVLRHAIVYGITSFDKLHKTLNDVWMPDVKKNQLPGVLSGLAAVRPLVNVGSGMRDLVVVPMREYKKDGRIVRSLQKGVYAFAKNTTSEVARLGAKVAIGTQNILEGAENFLNPESASPRLPSAIDWDGDDPSDDDSVEKRATSNYANQPIGVKSGLRSAARYLERDLLTARDAIIAIPTEVMEEGTGVGMARAIARRAPTVILRPALGATKAVSNALLGVGNALDGDSQRKIDDKYKSY